MVENIFIILISGFALLHINAYSLFAQEIGEKCVSCYGDFGVCRLQTDCERERTRNDDSEECSDYSSACKINEDGTPVVCCSKPKTRGKVISTDKLGDKPTSSTRNGKSTTASSSISWPNTQSLSSSTDVILKLNDFLLPDNFDEEANQVSEPYLSTDNIDNDNVQFDYDSDNKSRSDLSSRSSFGSRDRIYNFNQFNNPNRLDNGDQKFGREKQRANQYQPPRISSDKQRPTNDKNHKVQFPQQSNKFVGPGVSQSQWQGSRRGQGSTAQPNNNNIDSPSSTWTGTFLQKVPQEEPTWSTTRKNKPTTRSEVNQNRRRISEQKCEEYARTVTQTISAIPLSLDAQITSFNVQDCKQDAAQLIVGGTKAQLGEFPHMVALGFRRGGSSISYSCGGTLISEYFVATAAHCTHSSYGYPVTVLIGDINLIRDDDGARPINYQVAQVIVHPEYQQSALYNDIALIRLRQRVTFNQNVRPACLHQHFQLYTDKVIATGWGTVAFGASSSDDLLKVGLNVVDTKLCNRLYGSDAKLKEGIAKTMICAGNLSGKKDTCQGDSGGPLVIARNDNRCMHYLVGITSFGKICGDANSPGIYTRVSEYLPWIENVVWSATNKITATG